MNIIFFLIGCSVVIAISFLAAFFWSVKSGQYEDTYTPSVRMLFEDGSVKEGEESEDSEATQAGK